MNTFQFSIPAQLLRQYQQSDSQTCFDFDIQLASCLAWPHAVNHAMLSMRYTDFLFMLICDTVTLHAIIEHERNTELAQHVKKAKTQHKPQPKVINSTYTNPTIIACLSGPISPDEDLPVITVKPHFKAPIDNSDDTAQGQQDATLDAQLKEPLFLHSPTRSPSPAYNSTDKGHCNDKKKILTSPAPQSSAEILLQLNTVPPQPTTATMVPTSEPQATTIKLSTSSKKTKGSHPGPLSQE
ncbi:hypothetical protein M422DRAFT_48993 [Sphaerobolus stellatus SS14]|uniref:Uncharacterized protein n=1 Tax=Sphaerobolus stellatus (strain SS14) TaxID=990650 RepID=A0A0C9VRY1_SPHS4|nr:hypothetical protein M422DRAFT_48993 [Sphaerobolus stellatus SS14]